MKTGTIKKILGENLRRAKDLREKVDYSPHHTTPENVAEPLIKNAEDFHTTIKKKLEEPLTPLPPSENIIKKTRTHD